MTYVNKALLFLEDTPLEPIKRRSEGRLKTYRSAEDLRSWNNKVEDRRQQILNVVRRDIDECQSPLVRAILKFFKDKYVTDLKRCCKLIWRFVNQLPLSNDEKSRLQCLKSQLGKFFMQVIAGCTCAGDVGLICPCKGTKNLECVCGDLACICEPHRQKPKGVVSGTYKIKSAGPVRLVTKIRGIKPGLELPCDCVAVKAQRSPNKIVKVVKKVYPEGDKCSCTNNVGKVITLKTFSSRSGTSTTSTGTGRSNSQGGRKLIPCPAKSQYVYSLFEHSTPASKENVMFKKTGKDTLVEYGNPIKKLQDALEERESLCEEQQINIEYLKSERDKLNNRIQQCLKELDNLQPLDNEKYENISASSYGDVEGQRIREELDALKKYCLQLRGIEAENEKLKRDKDFLKRQLEMSSASMLTKDSKEVINDKTLNELIKERNTLKTKVKFLEHQLKQSNTRDLELYKDRSAMLDNTIAERDEMLRKLDDINDLKKELDEYRKKAERVEELEKALKYLRNDKTSDYDLRRAQSECTCLEKELENLKSERDALKRRIDFLVNEQESLKTKAKEAEVLRVERDKLQIKINDLAHVQMHNENLLLKCKSLESASNMGYLYKQKYEDLLVMECECQSWKSQVEAGEHVKKERDCLRKQVTDLQSVILEQESEIKKLMLQVETVIKHKDETQVRMREALTSMRDELETKDSLIAASEEKLEKVEAELKTSIQGVSCETICHKTRLEELEKELDYAKTEIKRLEARLKECKIVDYKNLTRISKSEYDSLGAMKRELDAAKAENKKLQEIAKKMVALTGDEHVQKMLQHSETAIRKVVAELSKQYKEWDHYKRERRRSRSRSYDRTVYYHGNETTNIGDIHNIQNEKELINNNLEDIKCPGTCQGELIALKLRNAQLLEKLQQHSYKNEKT